MTATARARPHGLGWPLAIVFALLPHRLVGQVYAPDRAIEGVLRGAHSQERTPDEPKR